MDRWSVHAAELLGTLYAINIINKAALQRWRLAGLHTRTAIIPGSDTRTKAMWGQLSWINLRIRETEMRERWSYAHQIINCPNPMP